jgi:hypothetical protein
MMLRLIRRRRRDGPPPAAAETSTSANRQTIAALRQLQRQACAFSHGLNRGTDITTTWVKNCSRFL